MGQRNILCTSQMIDSEMDQEGQGHLRPEPCVLLGSITNFPHPNIHTMLPAPGNTSNFDARHLPEHHDSAVFYGMTQYNGVQHHHPAANLDLVAATASNYYNPYITPPSGSRVFPVPLNHGPHDQLPSSNNYGIVGVSTESYGRNNHFMDGARGSFKRKNAELGNFQHCNASAGSSSSVAPFNARPLESDVTLMDATPLVASDYRGNGIPLIMEVGSHRSVRNRPGVISLDSVLAHNANNLIQGNYMGQPFQMVGTPWLDQQFSSNGSDGCNLSWNQAPALPYLHGNLTRNMNGGGMEAGNMGIQGYQVTASNRSSTSFLQPPPAHQGHPNLHHPPPPIQGVRGQNIDFHSQVAASSRRLPTNGTLQANMNPFQDNVDAGTRFVGPVPPTGLRICRPHQRELMLEATPRQRNFPHLRVLPEDGVAILEMSGYHEVGDSTDHHRDMRLDIDHMSYEELLALGEQIGSVGTGLSEETIISRLKARTFVSSTSHSNPEEAARADHEIDFCVICQADYKDQEKVGTLDCGHDYHVDCIKKWLLVKNTCPICKSSALTTERKDS